MDRYLDTVFATISHPEWILDEHLWMLEFGYVYIRMVMWRLEDIGEEKTR